MEVNLKNESLVSVSNVTSTLLSACFDLSLNSSHFIDEWNHDLMNELMTNRGCSCQDIVETNGLHNLFCAIRSLEHSWLVQVVYIILFGLIITMAIGGNSIVIWIVLAHKQMRTPMPVSRCSTSASTLSTYSTTTGGLAIFTAISVI
ncbi:neuromedin-K receptor [Trichinella spiralis]|uniref:neuromedin-K receptor n=1 Tax=Trichinella spiralis TaxID=6334 RepID=UPI0001EFC615|nr:neuromedin-K receptor [Trichinella spiralis]